MPAGTPEGPIEPRATARTAPTRAAIGRHAIPPSPDLRPRRRGTLIVNVGDNHAATTREAVFVSYSSRCRRTISVIQTGANGDVQPGEVG